MSHAVLHIGTEKTGSTSIQHALAHGGQALAESAVLYPRHWGRISHHRLVLLALDPEREETRREMLRIGGTKGRERERLLFEKHERELQGFHRDHPAGTVVYSSEHLQSRLHASEELERVRALLAPHHESIRVVVYLRRQDRLALSAYSSRLRNGHDSAFRFPPGADKPRYFDFLRLVELWSEVFGGENVTVRVFERERLHGGDVVSDFLELIGVDPEALGPAARATQENERLDAEAQALLLGFNRGFGRVAASETTRHAALRRAFLRWLAEADTDSAPYRPPRREAEAFYERFRDDNRVLADRWLDGAGFDESFDDYPETVADSAGAVAAVERISGFFRSELLG